MDRRRTSLTLLLLFVLCTGAAIVVGGSRPALQQGVLPSVVQSVGYLLALVAAALLLAAPHEHSGTRRTGGTVLGAVLVLVVADVLVPDGGANVGAGLLRVVGLLVLMVATIRLAREAAALR